jgi:hypothetical protein
MTRRTTNFSGNRFAVVAVTSGLILALAPHGAAAAKDVKLVPGPLGNAAKPFAARVIVNADGQILRGRLWHRPNMQRQEFEHTRMVRILRFDLNQVWTLDPKRRTVARARLDQVAEAAGVLSRERVTLARIGAESLDTGSATLFSLSGAARDGTVLSGKVWLGRHGVLLRQELIARSFKRAYQVRMELEGLRFTEVPRVLFQVPRGYRRLGGLPVWAPSVKRRKAEVLPGRRPAKATANRGLPKRHSLYELFKKR